MPDLPFPGEAPPWGEKLNNALRQRFTSLINSLGAHTNATAHVHGIPDTSKLVHADDLAPAARAATTRGTLPSGTDLNTLDTLGGADEAGAWLLSGSYTYGNQPPRTPGATAVLEVVVANAYTGIIQRVTEASGATWARNKVSTGAGAWTTWRRMDPHVDTTVGTRVFVGDVMIYGDTGWRDISGLLDPRIESVDLCALRRIGDFVTFAVRNLRPTEAGTIPLFPVEVPGAPWTGYEELRIPTTSSSGSVQVQAAARRFRLLGDASAIGRYSWTCTYPVSTAWPSVLPGIPL